MKSRILSVSSVVIIGCIFAFGAGTARADQIIGSATGLASPTQTITFDEILFPMNTLLTSQYSGLGVTFSPNVFYSPQTGFGNVQGNDIGNFTLLSPAAVDPVTMSFSTLQTAVAFSIDGDSTPYLFEALLGGLPVDSFSANVGVSNSDFYGFSNEVFDTIRITQTGAGGGPYWVADNIQFGAATATPEPGSLVLFGSGLIGVAGFIRKRVRR